MNTKRNIFLWVLYDFANSIVSVVFFLYFAQWIVVDQGVSDLSFNLTFTISAILLLFTIPISGCLLDTCLRRITGLRYSTLSTILFYGLCALAALSNKNTLALISFTLGLYSYLLSFTFYTPLLNDISQPQKRGFVSGLGIAANYAGQFVGLLIALPFSTGTFSLFGSSPRAETLLPSVIAFSLFSFPALLFFREPHKKPTSFSLWTHVQHTLTATKHLFASASVAFFLASFFLFNDAILTAINNYPLFLEQVWHVSDTVKTYLLLGTLVMCAIGGLFSGMLADRVGHKKTLFVILTGWIFLFPLVGLITHFPFFVIATILMGLWFGATWTVSRSVMAYVSPQGRHNLAFAYFGLAERASSLIGPLFWGFIVSNLVSLGSVRYRIAIIALTLFIVLGVFALKRVKADSPSSLSSK